MKTKTKIYIVLEIEGDPADAVSVVDDILDVGLLQDSINDHESDAGRLRVTSALLQMSGAARAS